MALAKDLQIYKDTYELVNKLVKYTENFPRKHKFTLGEKLIKVALELFEYIQLANMSIENRQRHLMGFTIKFELLKTILRLCFDRRLFSEAQAADICRLTTVIGRQATAWGRSGNGSPSRTGK